MEWEPRAENEIEATEFYRDEVMPMFGMAPDILRIRWLRVKSATFLSAGSSEASSGTETYTYLTVAEMSCEEWPWGELLELNALSQWTELFEGQRGVVS
jgi:hypothetical protein